MPDRPGALVISLDFELHWGVRDHVARGDALYQRLPEARHAVEDMLTLFGARHIRATWATVGFLFASNRRELEAHAAESATQLRTAGARSLRRDDRASTRSTIPNTSPAHSWT